MVAEGQRLLKGHSDLSSMTEDLQADVLDVVAAWQHYIRHWEGSISWVLIERLAAEVQAARPAEVQPNIRRHQGFSHGLRPGTTRDINCVSCQREDARLIMDEAEAARVLHSSLSGPSAVYDAKVALEAHGWPALAVAVLAASHNPDAVRRVLGSGEHS